MSAAAFIKGSPYQFTAPAQTTDPVEEGVSSLTAVGGYTDTFVVPTTGAVLITSDASPFIAAGTAQLTGGAGETGTLNIPTGAICVAQLQGTPPASSAAPLQVAITEGPTGKITFNGPTDAGTTVQFIVLQPWTAS